MTPESPGFSEPSQPGNGENIPTHDPQQTPEQPVDIPLEEPTYKPGEVEPDPAGPEVPPPSIPWQDPVPPQA
ncbi:MAG: hypothetical protein ABI673_00615 [Novosphingobium sp.]